ncbi:prephenate dehydrogenase (NADP(+)), partial [Ascosphaera pollenicola]
VNACDREESYEKLKEEYASENDINVLPNGHLVSRISDYIIYSVEAEAIDKIVALYGPSTKVGAIVGGQTSCKAPELAAFDKHLPEDVEIISIHSLHGPSVNPKGQPFVIIQHRASDESVRFVEEVFSTFESKYVHLSGEMHDRITADTQAVTHAAFLSMGQAWMANNQFPWELPRYVGGIENVKINITLRIYSNKWHVYAGLAILNPAAKKQVRQYAQSVSELFKLMLGGHGDEFKARVRAAGQAVFKTGTRRELLLEDEVLDRFSLGKTPSSKLPNSHLSLLAIVDCWWKLGIVPYDHMICSTPLFRLWLGVSEYVFRNENLLSEILDIAMNDNTFRSDDLEFAFAARAWSDCVSFGDFDSYRDRFENIQKYFAPRFPDAVKLGNEMMKTILAKTETHKETNDHTSYGTMMQCLAQGTQFEGAVLQHNGTVKHLTNVSFAVNIPDYTEESPNLVFLRLEAPVEGTEWFGLMHGTGFDGANMIAIYTSLSDSLTVSPRQAIDQKTFSFDTDRGISLLSGTGVYGRTMVANIRCEECMGWRDHNGSINASDQKSFWTWAYREGVPLNVWDPGHDLYPPTHHGTFTWNLSAATGGDAINPFDRTAKSDANAAPLLPNTSPPRKRISSVDRMTLERKRSIKLGGMGELEII